MVAASVSALTSTPALEHVVLFACPLEAASHPLTPDIAACRCGSSLCVTIGATLFVIATDTKKIASQVELDCAIDALCVHPTLPFAVLGDTLGSIHLVHVASGEVFYSQAFSPGGVGHDPSPVAQPGRVFTGVHVITGNNDVDELIVALANGTLFRLSNIDFAAIDRALTADSAAPVVDQIKEHVRVETVNLLSAPLDNLASVSVVGNTDLVVCGSGQSPLSLWRLVGDKTTCNDTLTRVFAGAGVVHAEILYGKNRLLAVLDTDFQFRLFEFPSLVAVGCARLPGLTGFWSCKDMPRDDFAAVFGQSKPTSGADSACILAIFGATSNQPTRVTLLSVPDLCTLWEYPLAPWVCLVRPRPGQQTRGYCEFITLLSNSANQPNVLEVGEPGKLQISKLGAASAVQAVRSLISAGRFDDAEQVAAESQIDVQSMYKMRVENLFSDLASQDKRPDSSHEEDTLSAIESIMSRIRDDCFVVGHCLSARPRSVAGARRLLELARVRADGGPSLASQESRSALSASVSSLSLHLATYCQLHTYDLAGWTEFRYKSNLEIVRRAVAGGDFPQALVVWRRHAASDANLRDSVPDILADIPSDTAVADILLMFNELQFHVVDTEQRVLIGDWLVDRARLVEARERRPHGALELAIRIEQLWLPGLSRPLAPASECTPSRLVAALARGRTLSLSGIDGDRPGRVRATELVARLRDLVCLWDSHGVRMSLSQHEADSPSGIAMGFLDSVSAPELLPSAIETHVRPYLARHRDLSLKTLLNDYCLTTMDVAAGAGRQQQPYSSWEPRVLAILPHIGDTSLEVDVVVELMRRTPIPWTADLDTHVRRCLEDTSARGHRDVVEQRRLMVLRLMMLDYGVTSFNVSDLGLVPRLLRHILSHTDRPRAVSDAMLIVRAYHHVKRSDVFFIRARALLSAGLVDRCCVLINSGVEDSQDGTRTERGDAHLEGVQNQRNVRDDDDDSDDNGGCITPRERVVLCHQTIAWIQLKLSAAIAEANTAVYASMVAAGAMLSAAMSRHGVDITNTMPTEDAFRRLGRIQSEFGELLPLSAVMATDAAESALEAYVRQHLSTHGHTGSFPNVYRFADAVGLDRPAVLRRLAVLLATAGHINDSITLCRELGNRWPCPATAHTLATCCRIILENTPLLTGSQNASGADALELTASLEGLGRSAVLHSDNDGDLARHIGLFKDLEMLHHIVRQSDAGIYRVSLTETRGRQTAGIMGGTGSSSSSSSSSSSLPMGSVAVLPPPSSTSTMFPEVDEKHADAGEEFRGIVFHDHHRESGLVFAAQPAVSHAVAFVLSAIAVSDSLYCDEAGALPPTTQSRTSSSGSGKGKRAAASTYGRETAFHHGGMLVEELMRHRHFQLAMRLSQRLVELSLMPDDAHTAMMAATATANRAQAQARINAGDDNHNSTSNVDDLGVLSDASVRERACEYAKASNTALFHLVPQILSAEKIDKHFALASILALDLQRAFEAFKSSMAINTSNFTRLEAAAQVGAAAGLVWTQRSFQVDCERIATHARWWQEFQLLGIPFDGAKFQAGAATGDYQRNIIPLFLRKTSGDVEAALEFASQYHIEDDFVYLDFVRQQLLGFANTASHRHESNAASEVAASVVTPGDVDHHVRIASVVGDIANKEKLVRLLMEECLPRIPAYHYEDITFMMEQVLRVEAGNRRAKSATMVLDILKSYRRATPPDVQELFEVFKASVDPTCPQSLLSSHRLDGSAATLVDLQKKFPQSRHRLPFHALMADPWTVLAPEISESTLPRLVPLCYVLGLSPDRLHLSLVQSKITLLKAALTDGSIIGNTGTGGRSGGRSGGSDDGGNEAVSIRGLRSADFRALVSKIKDTETAIQTAVRLGGCFPAGPDRISMFRFALQLAGRWLTSFKSGNAAIDTSSESVKPPHTEGASGAPATQAEMAGKADMTVERLKRAVAQAETEHDLRSNGFVSLVPLSAPTANPRELCLELYKLGAASPAQHRGVHDVVEAVAQRHALKLEDLQATFLLRLLQEAAGDRSAASSAATNAQTGASAIAPVSTTFKKMTAPPQNHPNHAVVLFMFERNGQHGVRLLLRIAYQTSAKVTTRVRTHALAILLQLARPGNIQSAGASEVDVRQDMSNLVYLQEFEDIGVVQSLQAFARCDKGALARSLWLSHHHQNQNSRLQRDDSEIDMRHLRLVCKLCIDFGVVRDSELVCGVVSRLVEAGDVWFALDALEAMCADARVFVQAWVPGVWAGAVVEATRRWMDKVVADHDDDDGLTSRLVQSVMTFPFDAVCLSDVARIVDDVAFMHPGVVSRYAILFLAHLPLTMATADEHLVAILHRASFDDLVALLDATSIVKALTPSPLLIHYTAVRTRIIPHVMQTIHDQSLFAEIATSNDHIDAFVAFLIRTDQIKRLLVATLLSSRVRQGMLLLRKYYAYHGIPVVPPHRDDLDAAGHDGDGKSDVVLSNVDLLKAYMTSHDLGVHANHILDVVETDSQKI